MYELSYLVEKKFGPFLPNRGDPYQNGPREIYVIFLFNFRLKLVIFVKLIVNFKLKNVSLVLFTN